MEVGGKQHLSLCRNKLLSILIVSVKSTEMGGFHAYMSQERSNVLGTEQNTHYLLCFVVGESI